MVEVLIATVILVFGLLGMAGTSALMGRQATLADLATERTAALQTTLEDLRALPFDSVKDGTARVGLLHVQWTVMATTNEWKVVQVVTAGPGTAEGVGGVPVLSGTVLDTFTYRIIRP